MSFLSQLSTFGLEAFSTDSTKKYRNALFANGLWQIRDEPVGEFTLKVQDFDGKKYGLTKDCKFSYTPKLPKIPHTIFNNILQYYKDIYATLKSEVYTSICWDIAKQDYFIYVPKQVVSGAAVTFENNAAIMNDPNIVIVCDVHSHNIMSALT